MAVVLLDPAAKAAPPRRVPRHLAIIMDGNGRWAKARGLPRVEGHRRGVAALRRAVRAAGELGCSYLTIYSFSSENWRRPAAEVGELMGLLKLFVRNDLAELHAQNIQVTILGERQGLADEIRALIDEAEALTRSNTGLRLIVAFNYGSRHEITKAMRLMAEAVAAGTLKPEAIDETAVARFLDTSGIPDPDLIIRTSGEERLSNFLLWQAAYAELMFLPVLWPDFDRHHLEEAFAEFGRRERRFGGLGDSVG